MPNSINMQPIVAIKNYDKGHRFGYSKTMMTTDELRTLLKIHLEKTKESGNAFARRLGIQQSSLSKLLNEETGIAFESAMKILDDIGYHLRLGRESMPQSDQSDVAALREKVEHLINERDALKSANRALEKNIAFMEEKLEAERTLEKNETQQEEGRERRSASTSAIVAESQPGTGV